MNVQFFLESLFLLPAGTKVVVINASGLQDRPVADLLASMDCDPPEILQEDEDICLGLAERQPSLVFLRIGQNHERGYDVLSAMAPFLYSQIYLPIIVVTTAQSEVDRSLLYELGVKDIFEVPIKREKYCYRLLNLLETQFLHHSLQKANTHLDQKVRQRTAELEEARLDIVDRLAIATNFRDDLTGTHVLRVGHISHAIALEMGLEAQEAEELGIAARLHDIGKIAVPDSILEKPDKLTEDEYIVMQQHALSGSAILSGSKGRLLVLAEEIARTHHEKWDGTGYPHGLSGEMIPISGRICAVADVFDSLTSQRHYKRAWPVESALRELESKAGTQFDPDVVAAFCRVYKREGDPYKLAA